MIRIFTKDRKNLTKDIDTWIVEWKTYKFGISDDFPKVRQCYQAFTDKQEAEELRDAVNAARKLIGMTALSDAYIYKQERNSI